jgi:hypothetical protein
MGRKPILGELALVHWDAAEATELAAELGSAGWRVKTGLGELKAVKASPPGAVVISLRRLPSHGRELADALWYTKWGRAIPIVFFDGQPDKVDATRTRFPNAQFVNWADVPAVLRKIAGNPQPQGVVVRRGSRKTARAGKVKAKKPFDSSKITVENGNVPGYSSKVNAAKYAAMRQAILAVLPKSAPGLTQSEIRRAVLEHLPEELFPGGAKAAWWAKTVQLDLEAKGIVIRDVNEKPLKWRKASALAR